MNAIIVQQQGLTLNDIHRVLNFDNKLQSKNSAVVYKSTLGKFHRFINVLDIPFEVVTRQTIIDYMVYQKEIEDLKNGSINTSIKALKRMYKMLREAGKIDHNPVEDIAYYPEPKVTSKGKWLNDESLQVIKRHLETGTSERYIRDFAIFNLMVKTGLRANELCNLKLKDIHYIDGKPSELFISHGKGDKERGQSQDSSSDGCTVRANGQG